MLLICDFNFVLIGLELFNFQLDYPVMCCQMIKIIISNIIRGALEMRSRGVFHRDLKPEACLQNIYHIFYLIQACSFYYEDNILKAFF